MKKILSFENILLLFIFFLPLYLIRVKGGFFSANFWETGFSAVFIYWLIKSWPEIKVEISNKKYLSFVFPIVVIFIGMVISTLISACYETSYSTNPLHSLGIIKSWFLVPIAFSVMAVFVFRINKLKLFTTYFYSAAGVAAISIFYLFSGQLTYDGRLQAFFNSPNYLAMYLAPAIIIAGIQNSKFKIQNYNAKFKILSNWISIAVILISFYFTFSYTAWLAAIISLSVVLYLNHKIKIRKLLASFIILAGLIIMLQLNSDKFSALTNFSGHSSAVSRIAIWKSASRMLKDNWILGVGPGNFQAIYLEYQKYFPPYPQWAVPHPHSLYLSFWLYGGFLGIFGFIWLIYSYFHKFLEKIKKAGNDPDIQTMAFISFGIIAYILLHGIFDTTYFKNDLAVVFWLALFSLI